MELQGFNMFVCIIWTCDWS